MEKVRLKAQYKWGYLQWIMLTVMMLFLLTLPLYALESQSVILKVVWYVLFSLLSVIGIIFIFINYQTAELSENSITIKCKFYEIRSIKWADIKKISIEKLAAGTAGLSFAYKEWIVIYTDTMQEGLNGGVNKRNKGPWYIRFSEENLHAINSLPQNLW